MSAIDDTAGGGVTYARGDTGQIIGVKVNGDEMVGGNITVREDLPYWLITEVPEF